MFHNRRWDSDQLTLRRLIDEGALGDVQRYESRFERWRPQLRDGAWRETTTPAEGGGVLLDSAPTWSTRRCSSSARWREVHGEVAHRRGGPADDDVFLALEHESGVVAAISGPRRSRRRPGPRLRVLGSEAAFVVDALDGQEEALAGRGAAGR